MSFSHSHHYLLRILFCHGCFSCILCVHFHFLVSFKWFLRFFPTVPIDPPLFFKSWHPTENTLSSNTFLTLPVQTNVLLRSLNFFEFSNFMESRLFITNYIIDSSRLPHTIFSSISLRVDTT